MDVVDAGEQIAGLGRRGMEQQFPDGTSESFVQGGGLGACRVASGGDLLDG